MLAISTNAARSRIEIFLGRCGISLITGSTAYFVKTCKQSTKRAAESQAIIAGLGKMNVIHYKVFKKEYFPAEDHTTGLAEITENRRKD